MAMTAGPKNLRPQTVGGLLDTTFRLYRRYFLPFLVLTICIDLPYLILESIFNIHSQSLLSSIIQDAQNPTRMQQDLFAQTPIVAGAFGFMLLSALIVTPLLYGSILHMVVSLQYDGQSTPTGSWTAFRHAWRRLLVVLGTNLLRWLIFVVCLAVGGGVIAGIGVLFSVIGLTSAAVAVAVTLLSITGFVFFIWLVVKMAFVPSTTLEEDISFITAIKRSFELTRGNMWRIVGYYIVIELIIFVVTTGFGLIFSVVPGKVLQSILTDLFSVLVTPFSLVAMANLYLDLRIRTEAPDLAAWLRDE